MIFLKKIHHHFYYFAELVVLLVGFFSIYMLRFSFQLQLTTLIIVLVFYVVMGIFHHATHHNLKGKIMVEYVLVSMLILAIFLFINTGKI